MQLLVTGATGLAGSALVSLLGEIAPDIALRGTHWSSTPEIRTDAVEYVKADLTRYEDCHAVAKGCDAAIMMAAVTGGVQSAVDAPYRQTTSNLIMDAQMLQALYEQGVKDVIFVSTATVYQDMEGTIHEDDLDLMQDPHGTYFGVGWAKRSAEKLCQFWRETMGMNIRVLRAANIYGPRATFHPKRSNFIPALIRKANEKMDPFEVWGSPSVTRDVIYTDDFVRAVWKVLTTKTDNYIFNVGSGKSVTVGEVVDYALKAADHQPGKLHYTDNAPSTIAKRELDISRIQNETGWKPLVTPEEGIRLTSDWWKENKETWEK
ncbi:NAD(P)-dependent oxidoreductase [Pseudodesulfovibrio sp. zrk46]|uniref:NAD-dependent epimerase/dehydratase family protein n=1 Tax=Pseudodesulfovibrio sp. zrk46 TaxID=2725288 RepID=UPI001449809A|nr:NAD(P)-dependent oxidoreductase [Pseudodesulfovibrio sp. zrk46]QJB55723.1 NAD(P)-dependent oxidoreductase [Pseudodesulfovibrio sp. zrk46]